MGRRFEFLDITKADAAFVAYGKDLNELFANAALAMFQVMTDVEKVERREAIEVEVDGEDLISLLVNWLNELLFYFDSEGLLFSKFEVNVDEKSKRLKAKCWGERFDEERHELKAHVKAATFHKSEVKKVNSEWRARIILDI